MLMNWFLYGPLSLLNFETYRKFLGSVTFLNKQRVLGSMLALVKRLVWRVTEQIKYVNFLKESLWLSYMYMYTSWLNRYIMPSKKFWDKRLECLLCRNMSFSIAGVIFNSLLASDCSLDCLRVEEIKYALGKYWHPADNLQLSYGERVQQINILDILYHEVVR